MVDFNEEDCIPHWGKFVDKVRHFRHGVLKPAKKNSALRQGCSTKGSKTRVRAKRH